MTCTAGNPERTPAERFHRLRPLLLLTVLMCAACGPKADADKNIKENIAAFYRLHEAAPPQGALSLSELIRFRPLLSVPLFEKLKDASVAEETHFAKNADLLAPLFEGDLLTARPQGFSAARAVDCTVNEDHAYCNTELDAADGANIIKWKERIFLVEDERGWMIDDIDFGRNNPPLRQGRLSAILQAGIERGRIESKDPVSDAPG
ncbi:MAG: hypothetical protein JWQ10_516 [Herbaspirillum sp.]|nr:hypothetical protein [Herbaspirillum sp.]